MQRKLASCTKSAQHLLRLLPVLFVAHLASTAGHGTHQQPHAQASLPGRGTHQPSAHPRKLRPVSPPPAPTPLAASAPDHSWVAWAVFGGVLGVTLAAEERLLAGAEAVSMRVAAAWLAGFASVCAALGLALAASESWAAPLEYASIMALNVALSPDNLVVFMMFLHHAQLPARHHRRVISHGFVLAVALRLVAMLGTAKLIESFSQLQLLLAVLVLAKGLQMVWEVARRAGAKRDDEPPPDAAQHWAVKCLQRVAPVRWTDETDGRCVGRDAVTGRLYCTRTSALVVAIGCSDLTFSSDNITAVLALTTDGFTIVTTMALSILLLRPAYFLLSSLVEYLDALDAALGVILVMIGTKLCLGQAGVEVPLWVFAGALTAWRIAVAVWVLLARRRRAEAAPLVAGDAERG